MRTDGFGLIRCNPFLLTRNKDSTLLAVFAIFRTFDMGLGKFPKISPERIQVRFSTGYVEVITEKLEPHLNHVSRNLLNINKFNILHREITIWVSLPQDRGETVVTGVHPYLNSSGKCLHLLQS